jgi:hypothetical protein
MLRDWDISYIAFENLLWAHNVIFVNFRMLQDGLLRNWFVNFVFLQDEMAHINLASPPSSFIKNAHVF